MDQTLTAEVADLLGDAELEQTRAAISAYDDAVTASGYGYIDSVNVGVATSDIVYAQVVSSTTAAYS